MNFCTYFNHSYLTKGLTLYHSLKATIHAPFTLWVLCIDDSTYRILNQLNLPNLRTLSLAELEEANPELAAAKNDRNFVEYLFTCTPAWPWYLINCFPEIDQITYLDADLYFFSSPEAVIEEMGEGSTYITPHRFPEHLKHLERYGIYNVGLLSFKNNNAGRTALEWWKARCIEWCYDRLEDGKYADQKYLDDWPTRFAEVVVSENKGVNLAPWNWSNYDIRAMHGQIMVDEQSLIFYHYQGLKMLSGWFYDPGFAEYGDMPRHIRRLLYAPYISALHHTNKMLRAAIAGFSPAYSGVNSRDYTWRTLIKHLLLGRVGFTSKLL